MSFSRKSSSVFAPQDLNALAQQTLELAAADYDLKKQFDFRNVKTHCELAPDLPQTICDGQQIQQAMLNLVRNAAQAMAEGGKETPRLTLRTSLLSPLTPADIPCVRLEIEDNGPGIPENVQARLFEPFFTTKDVGQGTGLGLWLCWSIVVERHAGRIWHEPVIAPGDSGAAGAQGSRFVIELPVERPSASLLAGK